MTAHEKLAKAISRLDYFRAPADDCRVCVLTFGGTLYELLDRSEGDGDDMEDGEPLTLGDLRELLRELGS